MKLTCDGTGLDLPIIYDIIKTSGKENCIYYYTASLM